MSPSVFFLCSNLTLFNWSTLILKRFFGEWNPLDYLALSIIIVVFEASYDLSRCWPSLRSVAIDFFLLKLSERFPIGDSLLSFNIYGVSLALYIVEFSWRKSGTPSLTSGLSIEAPPWRPPSIPVCRLD